LKNCAPWNIPVKSLTLFTVQRLNSAWSQQGQSRTSCSRTLARTSKIINIP
jgi:hypothetical protein